MKKNFFVLFIPLVFLYSCSVLSNGQLENINAFATATKNYAAFPGEVVKKTQQLHYNNDILEASALPDSALMIRSLTRAKEQWEKGIAFSKKMNLSLRLIQKYAALLAQLSSGSFTDDLGESTSELCGSLNNTVELFNAQFSTKIPGNVGEGISQIVKTIGTRFIKNKQSKALKEFIPMADTLVQITKDNLVNALETDLKPLIESYKATFQSDFNAIIFNHIQRADFNILRFYIQTNDDYETVELLRKKCISAAEKLASAHKKLSQNITRKKNLVELIQETKDFISDVKELYSFIKTPSPID
jgi:hypothetical protein